MSLTSNVEPHATARSSIRRAMRASTCADLEVVDRDRESDARRRRRGSLGGLRPISGRWYSDRSRPRCCDRLRSITTVAPASPTPRPPPRPGAARRPLPRAPLCRQEVQIRGRLRHHARRAMAKIEIRDLYKRFGRFRRSIWPQLRGRGRPRHGLLGPQRGREEHHAPRPARARASTVNATFAGQSTRSSDRPSAQVGAVLEDVPPFIPVARDAITCALAVAASTPPVAPR